MKVKVNFSYDPDEPDENDITGMSEEEYNKLVDAITELGGYDLDIEKAP